MGMENEQLFLNTEQDQMSDTYKYKTDQVVHSILSDSMNRVKALLNSKKSRINVLVNYLIDKETLTFEEFEEIYKSGFLKAATQ